MAIDTKTILTTIISLSFFLVRRAKRGRETRKWTSAGLNARDRRTAAPIICRVSRALALSPITKTEGKDRLLAVY